MCAKMFYMRINAINLMSGKQRAAKKICWPVICVGTEKVWLEKTFVIYLRKHLINCHRNIFILCDFAGPTGLLRLNLRFFSVGQITWLKNRKNLFEGPWPTAVPCSLRPFLSLLATMLWPPQSDSMCNLTRNGKRLAGMPECVRRFCIGWPGRPSTPTWTAHLLYPLSQWRSGRDARRVHQWPPRVTQNLRLPGTPSQPASNISWSLYCCCRSLRAKIT